MKKSATRQKSKRASPEATNLRSQPVNVSILPNLLGYNLRRAQIALWRDFNRVVREEDVRPGVFSLLVLVDANPGIAQIDLATQLDIDKATIVGLIHRMERQNWVERKTNTRDRRRNGVSITAQGRRALKSLLEEMLQHEQRFTSLFTASELSLLIAFLRRIHP